MHGHPHPYPNPNPISSLSPDSSPTPNPTPTPTPNPTQWRELGLLYVCPRGIYDDWFWMYASVHGARARVVTNDAMRDHRMDLLPERAFRRLGLGLGLCQG